MLWGSKWQTYGFNNMEPKIIGPFASMAVVGEFFPQHLISSRFGDLHWPAR